MKKYIFAGNFIFFAFFVFAQPDFKITLEPDFSADYQVIKETQFNKNNGLDLKAFDYRFNQKLQLSIKNIDNLFFSVGTRTHPEFSLSDWIIEYTSSSGIISAGLYNNSIYAGPAKILKAANYFDWLFSGNNYVNNKTNAAVQINFQNASISFVYAPVFSRIPETRSEEPIIPDTGSVYYLQNQYYYGAFDSGIFFAYSENSDNGDFSSGLWLDYAFSGNTMLYGELFWSNKKWLPYFSSENFNIFYDYKLGIRSVLGIMKSFSFIPFTLYAEAMYNSSGYYIDDWKNLSDNFSKLPHQAENLKALFLSKVNYNYMNMFTFSVYLRQDAKFWNFFSINTALFYYLPESFLFFPELTMNFDWGLKIKLSTLVPFALRNENIVFAECFPYKTKTSFSISFTIYTGS